MRSVAKFIRIILVLFLYGSAFGQQAPRAILVSLLEPIYPPLARQANIWGDVRVVVTIRPDETKEQVVEAGHPMLTQAALDSAKGSHFACKECSSPASYILIYQFRQIEGKNCCEAISQPVTVKQDVASVDEQGLPQTRIVLSAEHICLCDPAMQVTTQVRRSIKCLYLWRCSAH